MLSIFFVFFVWCIEALNAKLFIDVAPTRINFKEDILYASIGSASWVDFNNDLFPDLLSTHRWGECKASMTSGPYKTSCVTPYNWDFLENSNGYVLENTGEFPIIIADDLEQGDCHGGTNDCSSKFDPQMSVFVDIDNDGDFDLFVTSSSTSNGIWWNHGLHGLIGGRSIANQAGLSDMGGLHRTSVWIDVDRDSHLDVILINEHRNDGTDHPSMVYHHVITDGGAVNLQYPVLNNVIDNRPSSSQHFFKQMPSLLSFYSNGVVIASDFDGDLIMDELAVFVSYPIRCIMIYKLTLSSAVLLYTIRPPTFVKSPSVTDMQSIDYNNDNLFDLIVSYGCELIVFVMPINGNQNHIFAPIVIFSLQKPNAYFSNIVLFDLDNDSDLDVYLPTWSCDLTTNDDDCDDKEIRQDNILLENDNGRYIRLFDHGCEGQTCSARDAPASVIDFDNDGQMDLHVPCGRSVPSRDFLFKNTYPAASGIYNNYIKIRLIGTRSNHFGIGAIIHATVNNVDFDRFIITSSSSWANHDKRLHIGLGSYRLLRQLIIYWPSGIVQQVKNLHTGIEVIIKEMSATIDMNMPSVRVNGSSLSIFDVVSVIPLSSLFVNKLIKVSDTTLKAFMHIYKTGGTSFSSMLSQSLGPKIPSFSTHSSSVCKLTNRQDICNWNTTDWAPYQAIFGHDTSSSFKSCLCLSEAKLHRSIDYMTILREPISLRKSFYNEMVCRRGSGLPQKTMIKRRVCQDDDITLWLTSPLYQAETRFLQLKKIIDLKTIMSEYRLNPFSACHKSSSCSLVLTSFALNALANMPWFGIKEMWDESMCLLWHTMGWPSVVSVNLRQNSTSSESVFTTNDEMAMKDMEEPEVIVYGIAKSMLKRRISVVGRQLATNWRLKGKKVKDIFEPNKEDLPDGMSHDCYVMFITFFLKQFRDLS